MTTVLQSPTIGNFINALPGDLAQAAMSCSLPHLFDREIGVQLIAGLSHEASYAELLFSELLRLPFIYRSSAQTWQYTEDARSYCYAQLRAKDKEYYTLSSLMVQILSDIRDKQVENREEEDGDDDDKRWLLRQIQWQIAYHLAPVDSNACMHQLVLISNQAGFRRERLADHRLAIMVWNEQNSFLTKYRVEGMFIEGRYAYALHDWEKAEEKFTYVWKERAHDPLITANAGHLLGVILRQKGSESYRRQAEEILRSCLAMCRTLALHQREGLELMARVLNSLAATLIQNRQLDLLIEADLLLAESLRIDVELDNLIGQAHVLNTMATRLIALDAFSLASLEEAERLLQESLAISARIGDLRGRTRSTTSLAHVLILRFPGGPRLQEAERLLQQSLEVAQLIGDTHQQAIVLYRLGECYFLSDNLHKREMAPRFFLRSFRLWKRLKHRDGQMDTLERLQEIYKQLGKAKQLRGVGKRIQGLLVKDDGDGKTI